jgi:hypothetical protein
MGDLRAIINAARDAHHVIIAWQQEREEVEAYSPTRYQLPLDYLETTQKHKPEAGEQSTRRRKTPSLKKRFEKASTDNACGTRRASILRSNVKPSGGPWEIRKNYKERRRDCDSSCACKLGT